MRVLVCGSRGFNNPYIVYGKLNQLSNIESIISGGAIGPDSDAVYFARREQIAIELFIPNWNKHGKSAGFIRNREMILSRPDLVIAFWDEISRGTKHTIRLAEEYGIDYEIITR